MKATMWIVLALMLCCASIARSESDQERTGNIVEVQLFSEYEFVLYLPDEAGKAAVWEYTTGELMQIRYRIASVALKEVKYKLETCKKDHSRTCATVKGLRGSAIIRPIQEYAALDHIMKEFRGDIVSSDWAPRSYLDWMLAIAAYHNKYPSQDECLKRLQRGDPESAAYECGKPERITSDLDSDGLYFEHDISVIITKPAHTVIDVSWSH